jgi:2-amino-4-hydroxy-6-hydroxymethyldihydropteridine diphosphokinase
LPQIAYLSLGSNLGQRADHLRDAIMRLRKIGRVTAVSSFYETEPVEFVEQPWFVNCVMALETSSTAEELLQSLISIERELGRNRSAKQKKGPRIIDIDILLFGAQVIDSPQLTVPHPAMHERRFVLQPLAEMAPQLVHPKLKKTIAQLLRELPRGQSVRQIEFQTNAQRPTTEGPTKAE